MIDRVSLFLTAFTTIASIVGSAVHASTWIVQEMHVVGNRIVELNRSIEGFENRLNALEELHK